MIGAVSSQRTGKLAFVAAVRPQHGSGVVRCIAHTTNTGARGRVKTSKALLFDYLASIHDPERAAALFADDGVYEIPFLRARGVEPRHTGRADIAAAIFELLNLYPDFQIAPDKVDIQMDTPDDTFAEYVAHTSVVTRGRELRHLFTGYVVAEGGAIKLLRETFNMSALA